LAHTESSWFIATLISLADCHATSYFLVYNGSFTELSDDSLYTTYTSSFSVFCSCKNDFISLGFLVDLSTICNTQKRVHFDEFSSFLRESNHLKCFILFINSVPTSQLSPCRLHSGDLIFSNHVSYVDLLYYAMRYAPQYTELCYQRKKALYTVRPVTLFRAFFNIAMHSRRKEELLEASEGEDGRKALFLFFPK
jgi:hypothetical protein